MHKKFTYIQLKFSCSASYSSVFVSYNIAGTLITSLIQEPGHFMLSHLAKGPRKLFINLKSTVTDLCHVIPKLKKQKNKPITLEPEYWW